MSYDVLFKKAHGNEQQVAQQQQDVDEDRDAARARRVSTALLRRSSGDGEQSATDIASDGVKEANQTLPHADRIAQSFGPEHADTVRGIKAQVGGPAEAASQTLNAQAYATGDNVGFKKEPDVALAAHEAAHVVQQKAGVQLKGEGGGSSNHHEREADAVADRVVRGQSASDLLAPYAAKHVASASQSVQLKEEESSQFPARAERERKKYGKEFERGWDEVRDDTADPQKGVPFGGAGTDGAKLGGKSLGQAGYGAQLLGASARSAQAHGAQWGLIAQPVAPDSSTLDASLQDQANAVVRFKQSDWYGGDPKWVEKRKDYSADWCKDNMATLERHQFEQWRWCSAYNDWVPLANASHVAMAELVETAGLMGYDTSKDKDSARFIEGLEASLDMATQLVDAKVLGRNNAHSWSDRVGHGDAVSQAEPTLTGTEATPEIVELQDAYKGLQQAHFGIYQGLLEDRQAVLNAKKDQLGAQLAEINGTIAFWTGLAGFVQSGYGHASKAADGSYAKTIDAKFDGSKRYGYREQKKAADAAHELETGARNYHEFPSDKLAEHQQNFEDYYDTWGPGGRDDVEKGKTYQPPEISQRESSWVPPERRKNIKVDGTEPEPAPAVGEAAGFPSMSLSSIVGGALNLYYGDKVEMLTAKLDSINKQLQAVMGANAMVNTYSRIAAFRAAAQKLESVRKNMLDYRLKKRQQEMVQLGSKLDSYAVEHQKDLKQQSSAHLVPGQGKEMYTTMMAALAKVEQYRSLSGMALGTFPYNEFLLTITKLQHERNGERPPESAARDPDKAYKLPPSLRPMSETEIGIYQHIAGTYLMVLQLNEHWRIRLRGVESRFQTLMKKLEGFGEENEDVVGQKF